MKRRGPFAVANRVDIYRASHVPRRSHDSLEPTPKQPLPRRSGVYSTHSREINRLPILPSDIPRPLSVTRRYLPCATSTWTCVASQSSPLSTNSLIHVATVSRLMRGLRHVGRDRLKLYAAWPSNFSSRLMCIRISLASPLVDGSCFRHSRHHALSCAVTSNRKSVSFHSDASIGVPAISPGTSLS